MRSAYSPNSIFVSTSCLPGTEPLASRVSLYQGHGLNAIELGAGVSVTGEALSTVKELGVSLLVHNYFPPPPTPFVLNLASADEEIRRKSREMVRRALGLCRQLGAPFYSVHAGFITDPVGFDGTSFVFPAPSSPHEEQSAIDRFTASITSAVGQAREEDVELLIENNVTPKDLRGRLLLKTSPEFLSLFETVSSPKLGILLDTGHLNVTAKTFGLDPMVLVDQVAGYIKAFHVHENDGTADYHQPIQPGSWVLDVLRRPEFAHLPVVVEAKFETVADLRQHAEWLGTELHRG